MYHATTTDIPHRDPFAHKVAACIFGACLPLLGLMLEFSGSSIRWPVSRRVTDATSMFSVSLLLLLVFAYGLLRMFQHRVRIKGTTYRGRIETKHGEGVPLEVVWGRLHGVPFVVRLEDGRAALVEPVGLALETDQRDQEIDVGAEIEIIGTPSWTADAPTSAYRDSTVMCFAGNPRALVGLRVLR